MLKGIPPIVGPELLATLARMGHGDVLIVADANFPAHAQGRPVHHLDGHDSTTVIEAILQLLPLDRSGPAMFYMHPVEGPAVVTEVHAAVRQVAERIEGRRLDLEPVERFDFYRRARESFAIVVSGERQPFGCFGFAKGVIGPAHEEPGA